MNARIPIEISPNRFMTLVVFNALCLMLVAGGLLIGTEANAQTQASKTKKQLSKFGVVLPSYFDNRPQSENSTPATKPVDTEAPSIFAKKFSSTEIQTCIESMCGPASQNVSAYDPYMSWTKRPTLSASQTWDTRFRPRLAELIAIERSEGEKFLNSISELLKQKDIKIPDEHPMKTLGTFFLLADTLSKGIGDAPWSKRDPVTQNYSLDEESIQQKLKDETEEVRVAIKVYLSKTIIPLLNQAGAGAIDSMTANPLNSYLKRTYPDLEVSSAQVRHASEVLSKTESLKKNLGEKVLKVLLDQADLEIYAKAAKGAALGRDESDRYLNNLNNIQIFSSIYTDMELNRAIRNVKVDYDAEIQKLRDTNWMTRLKGENLLYSTEEKVAAISKICQEKLTKSLDLNASDLRIGRLQNMIRDIKPFAKKVAARYAQPDRLAKVERVIEDLEFAMPETNSEKLAEIDQAFDRAIRKSKASSNLASNQAVESRQSMLLLATIFNMKPQKEKTLEEEIESDDIKKVCDSLPVDTASDFALTSLGQISISWFTANYPEVGIGILAHEIGHVVSKTLREANPVNYGAPYTSSTYGQKQGESQPFAQLMNPQFAESLTCVANRNPYLVNRLDFLVPWLQNSPWSEEDFADHFSAMVMNELDKSDSIWRGSRNMSCALVLDMGDSYTETSLAPGKNDTHSSGALRLIMLGHDRGMLTPQCQPFADAIETAGRQMTCQ